MKDIDILKAKVKEMISNNLETSNRSGVVFVGFVEYSKEDTEDFMPDKDSIYVSKDPVDVLDSLWHVTNGKSMHYSQVASNDNLVEVVIIYLSHDDIKITILRTSFEDCFNH